MRRLTDLFRAVRMKALWLVGAVALGVLLGYWGAVQVHDTRAERWKAERDSLALEIAVSSAELVRLELDAVRWRVIAETPDTVRLPARRDTLHLMSVDTASVPTLRAAVNTLLREQAQLHDRIGRDAVKLQAYANLVASRDSSMSILTWQRDSLQALVNRAPVDKPRGANILGLRLCPVIGAGYGLTADGTHGPVLAVIQPLSCG